MTLAERLVAATMRNDFWVHYVMGDEWEVFDKFEYCLETGADGVVFTGTLQQIVELLEST